MWILRILLLVVTAVSLVVFLYALGQVDAPLPVAIGPPVILVLNFIYIWYSHPGHVPWATAERQVTTSAERSEGKQNAAPS